MLSTSNADELKNSIVDNQQIIDRLNADLARKTQEIHIIQEISSEISATLDLDTILNKMLLSLDKTFDFKHSMVLLVKEDREKLYVAASHGYPESGIGAEVKIGEGIIGVVAKRKKLMRMGNIRSQMAYLHTVKTQFAAAGQKMKDDISLPGLGDVESQVAIPLVSENRLVGVLVVESSQLNVFDKRDELIVTILASQAASAIEKARTHQELKNFTEHIEELVVKRTEEVVAQKEIIEEKNKNITDSIHYAKRIQQALLPSIHYTDEHLKDYFIFYKPRDIVSGDFYWVNKKENKLFFSIIDCTGHGVPGAFLSIMAHSNLQRATILFGLRNPGEILDKLNESVVDLFHRGVGSVDIKDGMDIALCSLERDTMKLEFSGANNPLYLIRNGELKEFKGDNQPIGEYFIRKKFSNHLIDLQKGDVIYIFSDGFADQFGGAKGKKFKYAPFKELLLSVHQKPMNEQKEIIKNTLESWIGELDQVDDISVMGVRV